VAVKSRQEKRRGEKSAPVDGIEERRKGKKKNGCKKKGGNGCDVWPTGRKYAIFSPMGGREKSG